MSWCTRLSTPGPTEAPSTHPTGGRRAYLFRRPSGPERSATIDAPADADLAADFTARRPHALERAYAVHATALYSVARHVLGNDDDAADCVHDALLRVWQRPASFRPERGSLRAYLCVCVRNEAVGRRRAAARHFTLERRADAEREPRYELEIEDHAERERLHNAFGALPLEQRQALELAYWRHLSHSQISEALGVPLGTIKSRLALGLRKLQLALAGSKRTAT